MQTPVDSELLAKYVAGQCNPTEKERVEQWVRASPDHARYLRSLQRVWSVSPTDETDPVPDTDASWRTLKSRMERPLPREAPPQLAWYAPWWRVAAVLLIGLGLGWSVYRFTNVDARPALVGRATGSERTVITLSDGSRVWLNQHSQLRYPAQFGGQADREVYLEGEAYFEVARNPRQPFLIRARQSVTRVLGTSFNVRAYGPDSVITVSVNSGKVAFQSAEAVDESVVVLPQQEALLETSGRITKRLIRDENYRSWQTGRITFRDTPLPAVVQTLNRCYGAKITLVAPTLARCKLTADFDHQSMGEVLEVLRLTLNVRYERRGNQIWLTGSGC